MNQTSTKPSADTAAKKRDRKAARVALAATLVDNETLAFPIQIAARIGMSSDEINVLKRKGCPFYGKKTCVAWVRAFLAKESGADQLSPSIG